LWVSRHPLNNSLVVFIHGIWGSRWATWQSYVDFFQRLPVERPLIRSYDVYLFNYATRRLRQPPLYTVVQELGNFLDDHKDRYDSIVFVCHSQGGIVGKLYILNELRAGRGGNMKIDMILTLNTPHRGADCRNPIVLLGILSGFFLSKIMIVRKFHFFRQLYDLAPFSDNIRLLKQHWGYPYILRYQPTSVTPRSRYIRSVAISGLKDWLVSKRSAEGFEVDEKNSLFTGHSVDALVVAEDIGRYLSQQDDGPRRVKEELRDIYASPERLKSFRKDFFEEAQSILHENLGPGTPASYIRRRASCFVDEFRTRFNRRPLRALRLIEAFKTYVGKVLND
jgi:pimeloyl-ACP methyl ester carboxylesterase